MLHFSQMKVPFLSVFRALEVDPPLLVLIVQFFLLQIGGGVAEPSLVIVVGTWREIRPHVQSASV